MNTKVVAISIGILGLAVLGTYFVLNNGKKPAPSGAPGSKPGTPTPPAYKPPVAVAAASSGSSYSPSSPSPAYAPPVLTITDPNSFIMGNDLIASVFTITYDTPNFDTQDISKSHDVGEDIGPFAGIDSSSGLAQAMVNSPTEGLVYVKATDVYQVAPSA